MQSNRITKLEGLEGLKELDQLYLSHNGIQSIEGLENNVSFAFSFWISYSWFQTKLTTLDLGANFISKLENVAHLSQLEELWVSWLNLTPLLKKSMSLRVQISSNRIPDLSALDTELKSIGTLKTLYLEMNPCQENDRTNYRRRVMLALPQLTQIDALYVIVSQNSCIHATELYRYTRGALNNWISQALHT